MRKRLTRSFWNRRNPTFLRRLIIWRFSALWLVLKFTRSGVNLTLLSTGKSDLWDTAEWDNGLQHAPLSALSHDHQTATHHANVLQDKHELLLLVGCTSTVSQGHPFHERSVTQRSEHSYLAGCFSPLQGPESLWDGNPRKMGKNCKIPLPGPTPENRENWPHKEEKLLQKYNFCNFSVFFPIFGGRSGERNFVIFPIFRGFPPQRLSGPSKGENNPQILPLKQNLE